MDSNGGMDLMSMMNMPGFHNRLLQSAVVNQNNEKDVAGCTVREMFVCQTNYIVENNIFVVVENNDNN